MKTQAIERFDVMNSEVLSTVEGGKTIYYGNGVYCNKTCWVDWGQTINSIATNSAMNWATQGNAGWHSGGVA